MSKDKTTQPARIIILLEDQCLDATPLFQKVHPFVTTRKELFEEFDQLEAILRKLYLTDTAPSKIEHFISLVNAIKKGLAQSKAYPFDFSGHTLDY